MDFTNRQKMNVLDAKQACLRLLAERRTKGRFALYVAVGELYESAIPTPAYRIRRHLREQTLAIGR